MTVYTPRSITEWPHLRRDNQAREEIAKLEARVRELEEALRFYADPENHESHIVTGPDGHGSYRGAAIDFDKGARARRSCRDWRA